ncbi:hypothetical protein [Gimesia sp.]|uniref:hypothetical protein n=1 Tax=Gimesia sp. TaxID=2024833 RepID=UPI0025C41508|nr:hypothetical protein [Gimesia sp.]
MKWLLVLLVFVVTSEQVAEAIEFHDIRWGFNDRLTAYHINPVTVLVENPDSTPFEGEIFFHQESFRGQQIDIALAATTYVAPFEKKWLQFYPYISDFNANWRISWSQKGIQHSKTFLSPRPVSDKSIIQLVAPDRLSTVIPGIKQFPEDLYPPVTGATDALQIMLLDHLPRWEKTRREAFKEWVYSGGILHIFHNSNGDPLLFPDSYSPLKRQASPAYYGNGVVYYHQQKLNDLSYAELLRTLNADKNSSVTSKILNVKKNPVQESDATYASCDSPRLADSRKVNYAASC